MNEDILTCIHDVTICIGRYCEEGKLRYEQYLKDKQEEDDNIEEVELNNNSTSKLNN